MNFTLAPGPLDNVEGVIEVSIGLRAVFFVENIKKVVVPIIPALGKLKQDLNETGKAD